MTDVFFACVTQHLQFGTINPNDVSIWSGPVQADRGIFKEVCQFTFTATQCGFGLTAISDVAFYADVAHRQTGTIVHRKCGQLDLPDATSFCAAADLTAILTAGLELFRYRRIDV